jgi:DNA-binding transcriptional LysR family regulator
MDRYLCIQAFVRVAEVQSFSLAAQQLGVTNSVITSRIRQLEAYVQAPLIERTTRKVALCESAKDFYKECLELLAQTDSLTGRMRLTQDNPLGTMRLQVLPGFALGPFAQALKEFTADYPGITLDITVSDQPADFIEAGYDLSLQVFTRGSDRLIERRLFDVRRVFCASPGYVARNGKPRQPVELLDHSFGLYSGYPTRDRWIFKRHGEEVHIQLPPRVRSNSVHLLRDYALTGGGITCLPTLCCADALLSGELVPLLTDFELPLLELLAIYPPSHRGSFKVKLLVDFLRKRFAGIPEWDQALQRILGHAATIESLEACL